MILIIHIMMMGRSAYSVHVSAKKWQGHTRVKSLSGDGTPPSLAAQIKFAPEREIKAVDWLCLKIYLASDRRQTEERANSLNFLLKMPFEDKHLLDTCQIFLNKGTVIRWSPKLIDLEKFTQICQNHGPKNPTMPKTTDKGKNSLCSSNKGLPGIHWDWTRCRSATVKRKLWIKSAT